MKLKRRKIKLIKEKENKMTKGNEKEKVKGKVKQRSVRGRDERKKKLGMRGVKIVIYNSDRERGKKEKIIRGTE